MLAHALTLGAYNPGSDRGVPADAAQAPVIHAVLSGSESQPENVTTSVATHAGSGSPGGREPTPSGSSGTLDLPVPEKWFTAAEVDIGAQPVTAVELVYPQNLVGPDAVRARVRVRVFIDERGAVQKVEVPRRAPAREFEEAARETWGAVRFSPAIKDGRAVKSQKLLELDFAPN